MVHPAMRISSLLNNNMASLVIFLVYSVDSTESADGTEVAPGSLTTRGEYCQWETFEAQCAKDEVIVMESAINGRMSYGRCIERDYGYVGCQQDVLTLADLRCSGRRSCKIEIPDRAFDLATPCPRDLTRFLIASYQCLKAFSPSRLECVGNTAVRVPLPSGYIASVSTGETGCGSTETPWLIEARPGQTTNITMYDFGLKSAHAQNDTKLTATSGGRGGLAGNSNAALGGGNCHVYCIVKERHTGRSLTVCGGSSRVTNVIESRGTSLELRVMPGSVDKTRYFLIKYEVNGCADYEAPIGGSVERTRDVSIVKCSPSQQTWQLTCTDNQWSGTKPECSTNRRGTASTDVKYDAANSSKTASFITMLAIAIIIGILIFVFGLCCFRRCRRQAAGRVPQSGGTYSPDDAMKHAKGCIQYDVSSPITQLCGFPGGPSGMSDKSKPSLVQYRMHDGENDYESMDDNGGVVFTPGCHGQMYIPNMVHPGLVSAYPSENGKLADGDGQLGKAQQVRHYAYAGRDCLPSVSVHQLIGNNGGNCFKTELH